MRKEPSFFRFPFSSQRLLTAGVALFALGSLAACTRPTQGFCNDDEDCDFGSYCELPAQECMVAIVIRGAFSGGQVIPPTASNVEGTYKLVVSADQQSGTYTLDQQVVNATKMELFLGKNTQTGSLVRALPLTPATGTITLDPDSVRALKVGDYYLQISSSTFPNGEVRAQLYSDTPTDTAEVVKLHGSLSGFQSSPANNTPAAGTADMTLDESSETVSYNFSYAGLQGTVSGIHVHRGSFNVNGPHIFNLPTTTNTTSSGVVMRQDIIDEISDPMQFQAQKHLWRILLKNGLGYLNIHSDPIFTKGEIRAQLLRTAALPFNTAMATPSGTGAQGQGQFYLSADGTMLAFRIDHNVVNPTSVEIANGIGASRKFLVCSDMQKTGGATLSQGYCPVVPAPMTNAIDLPALRGNMLYIVIKSQAVPAGEIEGKIVVPAP